MWRSGLAYTRIERATTSLRFDRNTQFLHSPTDEDFGHDLGNDRVIIVNHPKFGHCGIGETGSNGTARTTHSGKGIARTAHIVHGFKGNFQSTAGR